MMWDHVLGIWDQTIDGQKDLNMGSKVDKCSVDKVQTCRPPRPSTFSFIGRSHCDLCTAL